MLKKVILSEPAKDDDWNQYFELRWQILRAPWQQARGSERDENDFASAAVLVKHVMAKDAKGNLIGVGRIHQLNSELAQIRYMAVQKAHRRQGTAATILQYLESTAVEWRCNGIILNARLDVQLFYTHYDYKVAGEGELLFNKVRHVHLFKNLLAWS